MQWRAIKINWNIKKIWLRYDAKWAKQGRGIK